MTSFDIYWLSKLDDIRNMLDGGTLITVCRSLAGISFLLGSIMAILSIVGIGEFEDRLLKSIVKVRNVCIGIVSACLLVAVLLEVIVAFIPSTRQMAAIIVLPKIANSETVSELGDLGKDLVSMAKEWVEELRPSGKSKNPDEGAE